MKRFVSLIACMLCLALVIPAMGESTEAAAVAETESQAHIFLCPANFYAAYNYLIEVLADEIRESYGDEIAESLKSGYSLSDVDVQAMDSDPKGTILYLGNADWTVEASFTYVGELAEGDYNEPALNMNLSFRPDTPEIVLTLGTTILNTIVDVEYEDVPGMAEAIDEWFATADDPGDILELPDGYSLNYIRMDQQITYAILPPPEENVFAGQ